METTLTTQDANPYRLLQLHNGAPRTLVDETYWLLVNRAHRDPCAEDRERRVYLQNLNLAYETIVREGKPVAFAPLTVAEKRWFPMKKAATAPAPDPHKLLFVSSEANVDVVTHAAKVLAALVPPGVPRERWVQMLSDAATQITGMAPATVDSAEGVKHLQETGTAGLVDVPMPAVLPLAEAAAPGGMLQRVSQIEDPATPPLQPSRSAAGQVDGPLPGPEGSRSRTQPAQAKSTSVNGEASHLELQPVANGALASSDRETGAQQEGPAQSNARDRGVTMRETEPRRLGSWVPFLAVFNRRARQTRLFDERDSRLLELRDSKHDHIEANVHGNGRAGGLGNPEADWPEEPAATSASDAEGSAYVLRLEEIGERAHEHILGSGHTAARLQIWKQGNRYLLKQMDGSPLSVNGTALTCPLVVLEDGDEVTHDGERLTLRMS